MDTKIALVLPPELETLLQENSISYSEILQKEDIEFELSSGNTNLNYDDTGNSKDLVTLILASSGAVFAICSAITQIINTLYNKPYKVEIIENEEIVENGKVLKDKKGNPIFKQKKTFELLEPRQEHRKKNIEFSFGLKNGISIKFITDENEFNEIKGNEK